jgi:hypothetical protein
MDQRELLSHKSTRCILVFFENLISKLDFRQSSYRNRWFESFRDYLDVTQKGFINSKESGDYSEEKVLIEMKYLPSALKTWAIHHAIDMLLIDLNINPTNEQDVEIYLSDLRIVAGRLTQALDIPINNFYDCLDSFTSREKIQS